MSKQSGQQLLRGKILQIDDNNLPLEPEEICKLYTLEDHHSVNLVA